MLKLKEKTENMEENRVGMKKSDKLKESSRIASHKFKFQFSNLSVPNKFRNEKEAGLLSVLMARKQEQDVRQDAE